MKHLTAFIKNFCEHYHYPDEAVKEIYRIEQRLDDDESFAARFDAAVEGYLLPETDGIKEALEKIATLAEEYKENEYTLNLVFLLNCTPILKGRYAKVDIPENIFWDTMDDMRCKLIECMNCEEVVGIFVPDWYDGFFKMSRFAYGRFQYEINTYDYDFDFTTACGKRITCGDKLINFHIPSSGVPLTDEVRFDSYRRAYEAYKNYFPDGKVIFCCGSWLLYPKHREFLPQNLNILRFMDDFEIVTWKESDNFSNGWRVFGKDSDLPLEQLPRNTSLRRAYADWLCAGNKAGSAFGVFVFDGEKILKGDNIK